MSKITLILFCMRVHPSPTDLPILNISDKVKQKAIYEITSKLIIAEETRLRIDQCFIKEMKNGLSAHPDHKSSLQMENTYISELTNGREDGTYLALDLGGTNFRILLIKLVDGKLEEEDIVYYSIPQHIFLGEGTHLFDFLAENIENFMHRRSISHIHYNLGFTFSFPMTQKSVNVGILTNWTKSFNCPGVVGEDVVKLLNEAIKRNTDLDITVTCVLNDTTGTLVKGSYLDKRCAIGMILGTGHNLSYLEKVCNVGKWTGKHDEKEVIVDTEIGSLGDNGVLDFLKTEWDITVDDKSLPKKSFTYEKYISGKYMGDLVREVLVTLTKQSLLCAGSSKILERQGSLKTVHVGDIEADAMRGHTHHTKIVLSNLGLAKSFDQISDDDAKVVQYICGIVSYRAVLLVSTITSVLIKHMNRLHCTIAIDGSLFKHHPRFHLLMEYLIECYASDHEFNLMSTTDGSGKGAGLVAAIEERIRNEHYDH